MVQNFHCCIKELQYVWKLSGGEFSYERARLFCKWLSKQYNADPKRKSKKVRFRLQKLLDVGATSRELFEH
jgi:hypothetical protein